MISENLSFILQLCDFYGSLLKKMDQKLGMHGISFTEFVVLHALFSAPDHQMRRIDLAEAIGLTASGVTRLLKPMEKIHLISKQPAVRDARVSLVRLTETGEEIYGYALSRAEELAEKTTQSLSPLQVGQLQEYIKILQR